MTVPTCISSIDWAATGAMLSGEGTLLGGAAVIVAAIIGGTSFKSWRRQQVAGRKLTQAERILEATYKARRALSLRQRAEIGAGARLGRTRSM